MYQITIYLKTGLEDDQAGFLHEALAEEAGLLSLSLFKKDGQEQMILLFEDPLPFEELKELLATQITGFGDLYLSHEAEEFSQDQDWLEMCYRQNPPFQAGDFWVYGSHVKAPLPDDHLIPLCIDAVQAFGSGSHGTTKGCLELLCELKSRGVHLQKILDVGTGSGILAIAAQKLFSEAQIIASDNDPACLQATNRHAQQNNVILGQVLLAEGFDHSNINENAPYDLVIANILPSVLTGFEAELYGQAKQGAFILLSGIPAPREEEVLASYHAGRYELTSRTNHEEWISLLLQKA